MLTVSKLTCSRNFKYVSFKGRASMTETFAAIEVMHFKDVADSILTPFFQTAIRSTWKQANRNTRNYEIPTKNARNNLIGIEWE